MKHQHHQLARAVCTVGHRLLDVCGLGRAADQERVRRHAVPPGFGLQGTVQIGVDGGRVELSSTLATFSRAIESERANRVPALAAQYRSGSYDADSAATAGSMVSEALL